MYAKSISVFVLSTLSHNSGREGTMGRREPWEGDRVMDSVKSVSIARQMVGHCLDVK